jgi:hypothetical protein
MIKTRIQGILFASLFVVACQTQVPQKEPIASKSSEPTTASTSPTPSVGTVIAPSSEKPKEIVQEPQVTATPSPLVSIPPSVPSSTPTPIPTSSTSSSSGGSSGGSSNSPSFPVTTGTVAVSIDTQSPVKQ